VNHRNRKRQSERGKRERERKRERDGKKKKQLRAEVLGLLNVNFRPLSNFAQSFPSPFASFLAQKMSVNNTGGIKNKEEKTKINKENMTIFFSSPWILRGSTFFLSQLDTRH